MSLEALGALAVTALALALFVWNRLRPDAVALLIATLLIVTGLVTPQEGISGFSNEATITVGLLLVLSTGLVHTGAVDAAAGIAVRLAGKSERRLLLMTVGLVMPLSAFINNTAAVAILMPAVLGATRHVGATPSRLLLPLSFASQLGGTLTLIGTSTNLLVAGLMLDLGLERIRLFDITLPALVVAGAGGLYLLTVGRWLTPHRTESRDLLESYELHDYLTGLRVLPHSPLVGQSIGESRFGQTRGLHIIRIERAGGTFISAPGAATPIRQGDLLLVEGKIPDIARIRSEEGVDIEGADPTLTTPADAAGAEEADPIHFAEVMVPPRSRALGVTLRTLRLRSRYEVSALALRRHAEPLREPLGDVTLRPGDILLVQGRASGLRRLHEGGDLSLLGPVALPPRRRGKMKWALLVTLGAVLLAAFELVPIMVAAMAAVVILFVVRVLTPDEAYAGMDWMVVVLLGAILPLGIALEKSGAAAFIAEGVATVAAPMGPYALLAAVYLLTMLLTNAISNVAAAALVVPVAVALAQSLQLSPTPFAVGVMFAASNAFLTPIGYQTNLFVYGPGGYTFGDFLRLGTPLSVITSITSVFAIPFFLPFSG